MAYKMWRQHSSPLPDPQHNVSFSGSSVSSNMATTASTRNNSALASNASLEQVPTPGNKKFHLPRVEYSKATDRGARQWISRAFSKYSKTDLKNAILQAQVDSFETMDLESKPTPQQLAKKALDQLGPMRPSTEKRAQKYLEKKAIKWDSNLEVSKQGAIFGAGYHRPYELGLDGPLVLTPAKKAFALPVTIPAKVTAQLRLKGIPINKISDRAMFEVHKAVTEDDIDYTKQVVRNLSYDSEDTSIDIDKRYAMLKMIEVADYYPVIGEGQQDRRIRQDSSGIAEASVNKALSQSEMFSTLRVSASLPRNPGRKTVPNNMIHMFASDLLAESGQSLLDDYLPRCRTRQERLDLAHTLASPLLSCVARMHENKAPNGEPCPIAHGNVSLSNLYQHPDEKFRLENFTNSEVVVEKNGSKNKLHKDGFILGQILLKLYDSEWTSEVVADGKMWRGHESNPKDMELFKLRGRLDDVGRLLTQRDPEACISVPEASALLHNNMPPVYTKWEEVLKRPIPKPITKQASLDAVPA